MSLLAAHFEHSFLRFGPIAPQRPVIISVPHAARTYPAALRDMLRFPPERLRALEDYRVDLLAQDLIAQGYSTMVAHVPRLWIDLNRDPADFDPARIDAVPHNAPNRLSAKGRGGLGLIPDRLADFGPLWRRRIHWNDLCHRVETIHRPWHGALSELLSDARDIFGQSVLIDLHSMPPLSGQYSPKADIVIGDRFGSSAGDQLVSLAVAHFVGAGLRVARNLPYAGGYILNRHGEPRKGIHAIQVEVCRNLYLDATGEPDDRAQHLALEITALAEKLSTEIETPLALAAE